jgi:hypothetical protein
MEYSFPHYLLAKQSVDDRALNRHVLETLISALSVSPSHLLPSSVVKVVEVGAGIGTMLVRLLRWGLLPPATDYTLVDEMPENIAFAREWLPLWAGENGYRVETTSDGLRFLAPAVGQVSSSKSVHASVSVHLAQQDVFDFIQNKQQKSDLLIAHAFLDLLPMPASLDKLFSLLKPDGLAWLTLNFDGVTTLEPVVRLPVPFRVSVSESARASVSPLYPLSSTVDLDAHIERLYHRSMDKRPTGGDSQSGRHLFGHLRSVGAEILAAGASDWVVHAINGNYPADEAYFLHFILHFFESSLSNHPELEGKVFQDWLAERRKQIERGELVYIAHQMDFLAGI